MSLVNSSDSGVGLSKNVNFHTNEDYSLCHICDIEQTATINIKRFLCNTISKAHSISSQAYSDVYLLTYNLVVGRLNADQYCKKLLEYFGDCDLIKNSETMMKELNLLQKELEYLNSNCGVHHPTDSSVFNQSENSPTKGSDMRSSHTRISEKSTSYIHKSHTEFGENGPKKYYYFSTPIRPMSRQAGNKFDSVSNCESDMHGDFANIKSKSHSLQMNVLRNALNREIDGIMKKLDSDLHQMIENIVGNFSQYIS